MPLRCFMLLLGVFGALSACAAGPFARATSLDTVEAYRSFLREHPRDDSAPAARERLADLEFKRASQLHSVIAYKRYLEEFSDARDAAAARALLEGLRFGSVQEVGTARAFRQFLRDHPDGKHAPEAQARLAELELAELSSLAEPADVRAALSAAPSAAHRAKVEARLDEVTYAQAVSQGALAVFSYLRDFPAGSHRLDAQRLLAARRIEGLIASGLFAQARDAVARSPFRASFGELSRRLQSRERFLRRVRSEGALHPVLATHYLRSPADLQSALRAPDPLDRWQAVEELGQHVSVAVLDPLLGALRSARHPLIRDGALASLRNVLGALPREVADYELASRIEALRERAAGPELFLELAVLLDLSGQVASAAAEYRRAFLPAVPDPVILKRWAQLRTARKEHYSAAVAARQLAVWARAEAEAPSAPDALTAARQRCGAQRLGAYAREVIRAAASEKTEFPEDLEAFAQEAERAYQLAKAALSDAELKLRTEQPRARLCSDEAVAERLREGETLRAGALEVLRRSGHALAATLLEDAAEQDPSSDVRRRARMLVSAQPAP